MENGIAVSVLFLLFRSAKSGTERNKSGTLFFGNSRHDQKTVL
ncbi:MAG: hypothetical protein JWR76_2530 [Mucilaginibacter sp.]|nr:hypothetical protein [Mucilaginibacter sp.]